MPTKLGQDGAMKVVVSGTHGSGKSTLIGDFALANRDWIVLSDVFEDIDSAGEVPSASLFLDQLQLSAERLHEPSDQPVIAERGPLDFLAYLYALGDLGRTTLSRDRFDQARELTTQAMARIDLLVVLPLNEVDQIHIPEDEDLELRTAMDLALLELVDDSEVVGQTRVVEIVGDPTSRRAQLVAAINGVE